MSGGQRVRLFTAFAAGACVLTLAAPFAAWLVATGDPLVYFSHSAPAGQAPYVFSKLFGLLTIVLMWLQAMSALAKDSPALRGFMRLKGSHHALLGAAVLASAVSHVALFIVASTLRTQHIAFDLLLPTSAHGFYRTFIGVGAVAFWLLLFVVFAGWRRYRGHARWRWVHRLAFVVFGLAFLHGITVGSETRFGLMKYVYAFMGLSLTAALLSRLWEHARRPALANGIGHAAASRE
jgi:DMSO/TMAO reductase YedYZ heme-binding membrane subunit